MQLSGFLGEPSPMWTAGTNQSVSLLLYEMLEQLWKGFVEKHNPSDPS